jgi:AcrR family transcriptional regulator
VLDLIAEGVPSPTAQQIADRSGISIRTVFRLTEDVESLHAAAVQHQVDRIAPLFVPLPTEGSTDERIRALVANRAVIYEAIAPVRRIAERLAPGSPGIARGLEYNHRFLRSQVAEVFDTELSQMKRPLARDALDAADVASSWETWDQLRRVRKLSVEESARVVRLLLFGALPATTLSDHP